MGYRVFICYFGIWFAGSLKFFLRGIYIHSKQFLTKRNKLEIKLRIKRNIHNKPQIPLTVQLKRGSFSRNAEVFINIQTDDTEGRGESQFEKVKVGTLFKFYVTDKPSFFTDSCGNLLCEMGFMSLSDLLIYSRFLSLRHMISQGSKW